MWWCSLIFQDESGVRSYCFECLSLVGIFLMQMVVAGTKVAASIFVEGILFVGVRGTMETFLFFLFWGGLGVSSVVSASLSTLLD